MFSEAKIIKNNEWGSCSKVTFPVIIKAGGMQNIIFIFGPFRRPVEVLNSL